MKWLFLLLAACGHSPPRADAPACVEGFAPPGTIVDLRPVGVAAPQIVTAEGAYSLCGFSAGDYRLAFMRDNEELQADVTLGPGERRRLDVCLSDKSLVRCKISGAPSSF